MPSGREQARLRTMLALSCLAASLAPARASADDADRERCVAAHHQAQVEKTAHRLRAAKEQLLVCGRAACPELATARSGSPTSNRRSRRWSFRRALRTVVPLTRA